MKFAAKMMTCLPHKKGQTDKSYEGEVKDVEFEADNAEAAKSYMEVEAMSRQKAVRAHGTFGAMVRYFDLKEVS